MGWPDLYAMLDTCQVNAKKQDVKSATDRENAISTFPRLHQKVFEQGGASDAFMADTLSYPKDLDPNGNVVERLSESDHLQRATVLNHEYRVAQRDNRAKETVAEARRKASKVRLDLLNVNQKNKLCEENLLKVLGDPNPDSTGVAFGNSTLAHFEKCGTSKLLKGFIHARTWPGEKPKSPGWPKNKGKAEHGGEAINLVAMAWRCRNRPVIVTVPSEDAPVAMEVEDERTQAPQVTCVRMGNRFSGMKPSDYLSDNVWIEATKDAFVGVQFDVSVDDESKRRADDLGRRMFMNLDSHVDTKVEPAKADHSTLHFHRQNIPPCAALLTLANHVVDDIRGLEDLALKPSDYLSDNVWMEATKDAFVGVPFNVVVDDESKRRADDLGRRTTFMNLDSHVNNKVVPAKADHFTLRFHRQYMPPCAALLTLANHAVDDIPGSDYLAFLLNNPFGAEFAPVEGNLHDAERCYLYYDKKNGEWVRSGKVVESESSPKGMGQRKKEHFDEAKPGGTVSALYYWFPSKDIDTAKRAREMDMRPYPRNAYFEELIQFYGIGFNRGGSVDVHP
eukprot:CAMPEP_0194070696 /NCGR_PEP_ID=MMETSP0009_2-20130614/88315_1 /TAXON_ID=210454 /ORGANISM="Grammatophora oceanica, Strain CCMP 410" /LENGTH=562 /DNA_ID=CAMNT_0038723981 /DNA_START=1 /DNA_END=1686 /DNA_ORIENTATION=+